MCDWGNTVNIRVKIPADLSATGREEWKVKPIDSCIAPIVQALQDAGIDMRASCCGHGKPGRIDLADGRTLYLTPSRNTYKKFTSVGDSCHLATLRSEPTVMFVVCGAVNRVIQPTTSNLKRDYLRSIEF